MTPFHVTITEKQRERLAALSVTTGLTVSEVIRRLLDSYLHNLERALLEKDES
jgi:predicted DNA-binding protein